jgi:hypothetical protein
LIVSAHFNALTRFDPILAPDRGFAQKVDPIWNKPVSTASAGALARYEREARIIYSINKFEIERAAHAVRARAPALPALVVSFLPHHFLGKAPDGILGPALV